MKLSSQNTVDASISDVFAAISDFDEFEAMLSERGTKIERCGDIAPPSVGAEWTARFKWHDRLYDVRSELISVDPGQGYAIESKGGGIVCMAVVDLQAMSTSQTRLFVSFDFMATTFASKLLLQTLRLTGPSLNRRLDKRVAAYTSKITRTA